MNTHVIPHAIIESYYWKLVNMGVEVTILEGYDFGIAAPSCYMLGFVDTQGNVFLLDGFYAAEKTIEWQAAEIMKIRDYYGSGKSEKILADPDIFRRKPGGNRVVGKTIADMFRDEGISFERGNNDIINGVVKVSQYLYVQKFHQHPLTQDVGSPYLFMSDRLEFCINEITSYFWSKNTDGENVDKPQMKDDHAMDTMRYMLSHSPSISKLLIKLKDIHPVGLGKWTELERTQRVNAHRYG